MDSDTAQTAGVGIKDALDVCLWPGGPGRFANDARGRRGLVRWLAKDSIARVAHQATGVYHRDRDRCLATTGLAVTKVNPRQARRFAEAAGKLAKTDRYDAVMLARFGALLEGNVCQNTEESPPNRLPNAAAPTNAELLGLERGSGFSETACSAIIEVGFTNHMGNVG